jgi:hypothetical protein
MRASTRRRGRSVLPQKVLPKVTDRQVAERFQPVVLRLPAKTVASAADRGPDAIKWWKRGTSAPSLASAINMARDPRMKAVREWLLDMIGEEAEFDSERTVHERYLARSRAMDRGE